MSELPKTFMHCIRCDKDVTYDPIHTCNPSKKYRAGIVEGLKMSLKEVIETNTATEDSEWVQYAIKTKIQKIIKQYSGDE